MDTYEQNLQIVQERYPHIYHRLQTRTEPKFQIENSKVEGCPTISAQDDHGRFYLHSLYNPREEAKRLIEKVELNKLSSFWIMGLGMGYHVLELMNIRHRGFITVIIESDLNLFDVFLHTNVATEALKWPYFMFITGSEEQLELDVETVLQTKLNFSMGRVEFLTCPGFERYDGKTYRNLVNKAISYTKYRYNAMGNSIEDTLDGVKNSFLNVEVMANSPGIRNIENQYKGVPAIIVAAGPSLDKNIDLLKEAQGKALIISSDTTFQVLLKKGIIPDLVMTIERIPEVYDRFYKGVNIPTQTWLTALNVADNRVFEAFPDKHLVAFRVTEPLSRWMDVMTGNKGSLVTGLSVAHLAFSAALTAGCEPIILVGQDLALGEGDRYYVSGTAGDSKGEDPSDIVWVEDYNGSPIKTTVLLKHFLEWFENTLREVNVHCIDATEGGAKIAGSEIMTLREVLDQYCVNSPGIRPIGEMVQIPEPITLEHILDHVQNFKKDYEATIETMEEGLNLLDEMEKEELELKQKAIKTQEILNDSFRKVTFRSRVSFTLQAITSTAMTRLASRGQLENEEDMTYFMKYTRKFFSELTQASEICIYALDKIILDLKQRILEKASSLKEIAENV
ncbi:MAG: 6-hydroxymethylpterin diphosphokinase MptE-like protein [Chitinophagales bacterium]